MAATRRPKGEALIEEDAEDILEEAGAETDEETGELLVDKETVRKMGVADTESELTNRRRRHAAAKRRRGEKVLFDTGDVLDKYDNLLQSFPVSAFYIKVKRLTGPEFDGYIRNFPASGVDLFEALKELHGQNPSYQYMIDVKRTGTNTQATSGRVTVPDTRPMHMQQGQPMPQYNGAPQAAPAPAAPPSQLQEMEQMFELFKKMQGGRQAPAPVAPQVPQQAPMTQMEQMFELFMKMQGGQPAPQPVVVQAPPVQPAPAQPDPIHQMSAMFEMFMKMQSAMRPPEPRFPRQERDPNDPVMRRPAYGPNGSNGAPPQQPERPRTPAESLRSALTEIRSFKSMMREIDSTLPGAAAVVGDNEPDEDGTTYTEEIGKVKIVRKRDDDEVQPWATGLANFPDAVKWVTDTYDKFKKEAEEKKRQEQRRVLPAGYIEVIPGQPVHVPEGYRATIVSEEEAQAVQQPVITPAPEPMQELPPVPEDIPPPIQATAPWSQPIVPEES